MCSTERITATTTVLSEGKAVGNGLLCIAYRCDYIFVGGDVRSIKHLDNLSKEASTIVDDDSYDILFYQSGFECLLSLLVLSSFHIPVLWIPGNVLLSCSFHDVA